MRRLALFLAIGVSLPSLAVAATDPCGGGSSNLIGTVIIGSFAPGAVKLEWAVWEDGSTREYRVDRYPTGCDRPACATRIARVRPSGGPPAVRTYSLIDTAQPGAWIYRLEIRRTHGPSCTLESAEVIVDAPAACDAAALCAQVQASLLGEVITSGATADNVKLRWATHAENGAGSYRLSRFNCPAPRDCTAEVATVDATGSCGQVMLHSVTDTPPAGTWTYVLDVLDSGGRPACALRLPAPASPASRR